MRGIVLAHTLYPDPAQRPMHDIDLLIRRTLGYALLTSALAVGYFSSVVVLQGVLPNQSAITTVASTLLIATLFTPLRKRFQDGIDRRFYRRRYDAERILTEFGARMRDHVELTSLVNELIKSSTKTMEPAFISLWLVDRPKAGSTSTAKSV